MCAGANDVANAFGTSVGAKALTLKQVVIVASFTEFGGAMLLGSGVTDTIRSGIAKSSAFTYEPDLLMYGMLCALLSAGLWILLATFWEVCQLVPTPRQPKRALLCFTTGNQPLYRSRGDATACHDGLRSAVAQMAQLLA